MKQIQFGALAALLVIVVAGSMSSCKGRNQKKAGAEVAPTEAVAPAAAPTEEELCLTAVDKFIVDSLGSQYRQGEVCIASHRVVDVDASDPADIKVYGDFWVDNFVVAGDTLKTVSGGSHPGLAHVAKTEDGYKVTSFDAVGDGSDYMPSIKRIFGDKTEDFAKIVSDNEGRAAARRSAVSKYVKDNGLEVTVIKDYGWDPITLE
jgi:hypothetical protein